MRYTGPMSETRTRNEYGDYVCTECGTTSNHHFNVSYGPDADGFTGWEPCPNEAREPRPHNSNTGGSVGIVQALRKRDEGPYVLFDRMAMKYLREDNGGRFLFTNRENATVYGGITEASIRAMMAGGEARAMAL